MHDDSCGGPAARDLSASFIDDAERWLTQWMREGMASGRPIDMRDFKAAVTAKRYLFDVRKSFKELYENDRPNDAGRRLDPEDFRRRVFEAMGKEIPDDVDEDVPGALPDCRSCHQWPRARPTQNAVRCRWGGPAPVQARR